MSKSYTTIEQSKKLIELGIDVNTADMVYLLDITMPNGQCRLLPKDDFATTDGDNLQAWSLSALFEMMPKIDNFYYPSIYKGSYGLIACMYSIEDNKILKVFRGDTPIDAAFEMVCWLLENKKI
jgi:hypothetical protein